MRTLSFGLFQLTTSRSGKSSGGGIFTIAKLFGLALDEAQ